MQDVRRANKSLPKMKTVISGYLQSFLVCTLLVCAVGGGGSLAAAAAAAAADSVAPTIDYSHNMRILKLPQSTPVGSLIYRLKGSDGDANSQLTFGVGGHEARTLLDVVPVQRSWNEADVYLRSKPDQMHYNFTLFVTDGNKTTQVESTILITDDSQPGTIFQQQANTTTNSLLPFLNTKHVFNVPENAKPNELIGSISVLESEKSDLPVRFELRGKGAEKFSINYVFGPKGQSRGELILAAQELDYERQNLFSLKVLALNAWTDTRLDTRNVASMDIVITVGDVQDSPPVFRNVPQSIKLPTDLEAGQPIYRCEAEDGDYADQRPIQFALDANSPLANHFDIDKSSCQIRLTKSVPELLLHPAWQQQQQQQALMLAIFASELPDPSSYDHLWPPMYARVEIPLLLVDTRNEAPQFVGGWQTRDLLGGGAGQRRAGQPATMSTLHGYLPEWTEASGQQQLVVRWFTNGSSAAAAAAADTGGHSDLLDGLSKSLANRPFVLDLGLGSNGTFELSLEGADAELFHLEPTGFPISRQTTFTLSVAEHADRSLFDHEHNNKFSHLFTVDVVARDFGQPERLTSKIRCLIELIDSNDNWPKFESDLYSFSVYENAPIGYTLGQVRARDSDSSGKVSYVALSGIDSHLFRLNQDSGQVTLENHLDRERKSLYLFLVEARDSTSDHGLANYTKLIINVLDVNDNAPTFLQSHYDAVLLADGTFFQPLQVRAVDADEPGTANSQVAYEIIAGNLNEQFSIDSVSGVIYPNPGGSGAGGGSGKQYPASFPVAPLPAELPSTLKEPILPHRFEPHQSQHSSLDPTGKIKPTHEVEDSPRASKRLQQSPAASGQQQFDRQTATVRPAELPAMDVEQLPALDLLMSLESAAANSAEPRPADFVSAAVASAPGRTGGVGGAGAGLSPNQPSPITTLVVRAHDFGIPLRSSTVKVNIFNQALLTRSVSLILNGTTEQLDSKRDAIERAFSSLTGSRATIESLDALSDSSSLSVARVRLAVPEHSLVDLTDLSALMSAIEYRAPAQEQPGRPASFYFEGGSRTPSSSNLSSSNGLGSTHLGHNIFSDIHSYAIDSNAALERRLLVYIIIVGVCILALLAAWMIYYCCSRNDQKLMMISPAQPAPATYRPASAAATDAANKTHAKMAASSTSLVGNEQTNHHGVGSPIANNLAKGRASQQQQPAPIERSMSNLLTPDANQITIKPNSNYSMYNGQVWFEPNGSNSLSFRQQPFAGSNNNTNIAANNRSIASDFGLERRASSAPSGGGNSLDSALHSVLRAGQAGHAPSWAARNAQGQFFPNTLGYTRNVASIAANQPDAYSRTIAKRPAGRASRKVAPMADHESADPRGKTLARRHQRQNMVDGGGHSNRTFVGDDDNDQHDLDLEAGRSRRHRQQQQHPYRKQSSLDSTGSTTATGADNCSTADEISMEAPASSSVRAAEMSVELDSDQELLGFDSTGTPIIATHTRATSIKPIVVECGDRIGPQSSAAPSSVLQLSPPRETPSAAVPANTADPRGVEDQARDGAAGAATKTEASSPAELKASEIKDEQDREQTVAESLETENRQKEEANNKSTTQATVVDKTRPQVSPIQTTSTASPLMSELTELISRRKGSADSKDVGASTSVAPAAAACGGAEEPAAAAAGLASSTSASNKRQLMLRQQQQGKTTKSTLSRADKTLTRSETQTSEQSADDRSSLDTVSISSRARELASMKNGELLEKKSIFAITYSGLATDKLPAD